MKVTIIERQNFEDYQLKQSKELVCYPSSMRELSKIPVGYKAKKIKLDVEFDVEDIPDLIEFLHNCKPCFNK